MKTLDIQSLSSAVGRIFAAVDGRTQSFANASGVSCPVGCGACCSRPGGVEARVAEMLPAAFALLAGSDEYAADVHQRAVDDPDGRCVFFMPESADGSRGKCSHYAERPGVCRLFGFAANNDKHGHARLSTCNILRSDAWGARVDSGELDPPSMMTVGAAIEELAGALTGFGEILPINRALQAALTRASFASR